MPFVKLDVGILDSSLWILREQRDLFITALCMAMPYHLDEPAEELETEGTKKTGLIIPAGWYGIVRASSLGIIGRARLDQDFPIEELIKELAELSQPDPWSRSEDFEGRRMVRISGGFLILNYSRYRELDRTQAERSKRYRDAKRFESSRRDDRDATPRHSKSSRNATQAEAEAEAEEKTKKKSSPMGSAPQRQSMTLSAILDELKPLYPGIDLEAEGRKMAAWKTIPKNQKRNINRQFIVNWLNKIEPKIQTESKTGPVEEWAKKEGVQAW